MKPLRPFIAIVVCGFAVRSPGQRKAEIHARLSEVTSVFAGLTHRVAPIHDSHVRQRIVEGITVSLDYDAYTDRRLISVYVYEYQTVDQAVKATTSSLLRSAPGFWPAKGFYGELIGDECYHGGSPDKPAKSAYLRIRAGQRVISYRTESAHELKGADRLLQKADLEEMTSNAKKMVQILSKIPLKAAIR